MNMKIRGKTVRWEWSLMGVNEKQVITKEHWIQRITFAAETNAEDTHTERDSVIDGRRATQYLLHSLSEGEGKNISNRMS